VYLHPGIGPLRTPPTGAKDCMCLVSANRLDFRVPLRKAAHSPLAPKHGVGSKTRCGTAPRHRGGGRWRGIRATMLAVPTAQGRIDQLYDTGCLAT
jgi:hypothetical protein